MADEFTSGEASPEELRALSADDLSLTDMARQPTLGKLSDAEVLSLIGRLQEKIGAAEAPKRGFLEQALQRTEAEQARRV
jgi:hypothetical protein